MDGSDNMENTNNISREEVDCFDEVEAFNYQLMDMYVKQKDYDSAKMIAEKYPNNEMIQYKLITICIESKRFEEGIEIAKKYNYVKKDDIIVIAGGASILSCHDEATTNRTIGGVLKI